MKTRFVCDTYHPFLIKFRLEKANMFFILCRNLFTWSNVVSHFSIKSYLERMFILWHVCLLWLCVLLFFFLCLLLFLHIQFRSLRKINIWSTCSNGKISVRTHRSVIIWRWWVFIDWTLGRRQKISVLTLTVFIYKWTNWV